MLATMSAIAQCYRSGCHMRASLQLVCSDRSGMFLYPLCDVDGSSSNTFVLLQAIDPDLDLPASSPVSSSGS